MFDTIAPSDLGPAETLGAAVEQRRVADQAEASLLRLAVHFADLHPVVDDAPRAGWGDPHLLGGTEQLAPLAGEGTPEVAEFAPEELAAALSLSSDAGKQLMADSLELCFRLPRLWDLVMSGNLQAWRARQVAAETTHLTPEAADFVDRQLAHAARRNRLPRFRELVREALLRFDPETAATLEREERDRRGVWLDHREGGPASTRIFAITDTVDALRLDATLADVASTLGRLGDTSPVEVRRASALGVLADPQAALDLAAGPDRSDEQAGPGASDTSGVKGVSRRPFGGTAATLYLHLDAADLERDLAADTTDNGDSTETSGGVRTGGVEKLGAGTLRLLRDWCGRVDTLTVRPVLDLADARTVDRHDPPSWMQEVVRLRDRHCVFPHCRTDARSCDLDHIEAYDENGPPGQTSADRLACLCRRHHRVKTFGRWRYERTETGDYRWTSPHGSTYSTTPTGTRRLA